MNSIVIAVNEPTHAAEVRRNARHLAITLGFDEIGAERVAIVATELATNVLKHGSGGQIILSVAPEGQVIEMLALDRGSGMINTQDCARDGYSSTGTAGNGLGAIQRMSAFCEIYSNDSTGTAMLARVAARETAMHKADVHGIRVPKSGEEVCGDAWGILRRNGRRTILLADGLGHGPDAAAASRTAVDILLSGHDRGPKDVVELMHQGMRHTRGAAVGVAEIDPANHRVLFAGLGNIAGRICADNSTSALVSVNGTAGVEARAVREFQYPWRSGASLILHSDGLTNRWNLEKYPGLLSRDPGLIAGVLFRDFARGNDDASIVVLQ